MDDSLNIYYNRNIYSHSYFTFEMISWWQERIIAPNYYKVGDTLQIVKYSK